MDWKKITTWEDVCIANNESPDSLPDVSKLSEKDGKFIINEHKLVKAVKAVNAGWKPDPFSKNQNKYILWPDIVKDDKHPSGLGLSFYVLDIWNTVTLAGPRLCVENEKKLRHLFDNFYDLYHSHFIES